MMASHYVHQLVEKKQSLRDYALSCAKAFGHLYRLRDASSDAPVPDPLVPDEHHRRGLEAATAELARLEAMSAEERFSYGHDWKKRRAEELRASIKRSADEMQQVASTLGRVLAWEPPSPQHVELKTFMHKQLTDALKDNSNEWAYQALDVIEKEQPLSLFSNALLNATRDVCYHAENWAKEQARTADANQWLQQLRDSIKETGGRA